MENSQNLISPEQAADYLNVSTATLANWRCLGTPNVPYLRIGRSIKYRRSDLDDYIKKHSFNDVDDFSKD